MNSGDSGIRSGAWHDNGNINTEEYCLSGKLLTKEEFNNRNDPCNVSGKVVEIDGKKYKLKEV